MQIEEKVMTENDVKKKYLKSYQKHKAAVKRIDLEIEELQEMAETIPAIRNDGMPHGSATGDLSVYAAKLDELKRERNNERYQRIKSYVEIDKRIKQLESDEEINVMVYKYIKGYTWWKVAKIMNYSERWIQEIHDRALNNFKLPKEFIEIHTNM